MFLLKSNVKAIIKFGIQVVLDKHVHRIIGFGYNKFYRTNFLVVICILTIFIQQNRNHKLPVRRIL